MKNISNWVIGGILLLTVLSFGAVFYLTRSSEEEVGKGSTSSEALDTVLESENDDDAVENPDGSEIEQPTDSMPGEYSEYAESKLSKANEGKVVLFFYATWCPTCNALDRNIKADLDSIPSNLTILKTEYEPGGELEKRYGVTYQHTLVQVDSEGNLLKKWSGSYYIDEIADEAI